MKVTVDPDLCIGCEVCTEVCPEVFRMNEDGLAWAFVDEPTEELWGCAREAEDSCPVDAITVAG